MAYVAAAIAALGAIVSAYATYQQSKAQSESLRYQSEQARNQATAAQHAAGIAAQNEHEKNQRVLAAQRARYGAAGVMGSEGTPLLVQMQSAETAALEEARIRYGGEVQAQNLESASRLRRYEANVTRRAGVVAAGASLLKGAGSAAGAYGGTTASSTAGADVAL